MGPQNQCAAFWSWQLKSPATVVTLNGSESQPLFFFPTSIPNFWLFTLYFGSLLFIGLPDLFLPHWMKAETESPNYMMWGVEKHHLFCFVCGISPEQLWGSLGKLPPSPLIHLGRGQIPTYSHSPVPELHIKQHAGFLCLHCYHEQI